jgi:hypothetical protein
MAQPQGQARCVKRTHLAPDVRWNAEKQRKKVMTTIITRLYAAEEQAVGAVSALKRKFGEGEINLVTPTGSHEADIEGLAVQGGVRRSDASVYAEKVRQGHSLVTVRAPWGFANEAIALLDAHGPVEAGVEQSEYHVVPVSHEASPFSDWLGWAVLTKFKSPIVLKTDDPAPFSAYLKQPTLSKSQSSTKLLNDAAPFSERLGQPTLKDEKPFSKLAENDKSQVTLIKDPAPLSGFFHLQVISEDRYTQKP